MVMSKIGLQVREKSLNRWIFHGRNFGFSPEVLNPLEQKVSGEIFLMLGLFWPNILPKIYLTKQLVWQNMSWWCNLDFANIRQNAGRRTCWLVDISAKKGAAPMLKIMPPSSPATASLKPRHPLMFDFFFRKATWSCKKKSKRKVRAQCFSFCPTLNCLYCKLEIQRFSWNNTLLGSPKVREEDDLACPWEEPQRQRRVLLNQRSESNLAWNHCGHKCGTRCMAGWVQALLFLDLMASCSVEFLMAEIGYVVGGKHQLFRAVDPQNWGTAFVWKAANESTHQEKAQLGKYMNMLRRYF